MMIDESTSLELKKAVKSGDYEKFISFVNNSNINTSDHFMVKEKVVVGRSFNLH